ncbi:MAG: hypothetical protein ACREIS_02470 [Nitrospiraceae bacterium]
MPLLWCSISGHGFGHAAQVVPVLNELSRRVPHLKAVLRTTVPRWFFEGRLRLAWELSPATQDIGCVQQGPLKIDVEATWAEHARFHAGWEENVRDEARAIRSSAPDLVLSDVSHLAIEAAVQAGIPTVGLCNLSWDRVLELLLAPDEPERRDQLAVMRQIERSYGLADLMIRPAPGITLPAFGKVVDVGAIAGTTGSEEPRLRETLGADPSELVVLIAFGGIALDSLPFDQLERLPGYRFIVSGPTPEGFQRIRSTVSLPCSFDSLMTSADIIVSKPGYSTIVETVARSKPLVYVRRYNFADEAALVDYVHRYGRAAELTLDDFTTGRWERALDAALCDSKQSEPPPPATGAAEAAALLASYLRVPESRQTTS